MFFDLPTKIYSERNCVKKYAEEWTSLGTSALIVTGRSSAYNGSLEDVTEVLQDKGIAYTIYNQIEENPSVETVMKAREVGVEQKVDFVIGIGGGSPMDAAKAIALMVMHREKGADFLYEAGPDEALPVVAIPTTCGTGSEATPYAVLTVHEKHTKASISHRIFPRYALLDGRYLENASRTLVIHTAVDALGHYIESYINSNATDFSRMLCTYGLELWSSCKHVLIGASATDQELDRLMTASCIAGMAISHTGTALPHGLSYYLTYEKGIPHGKAVGYFLPGYLEQASPMVARKVLHLAGFPDLQYFRSFMHQLIGKADMEEELAEKAVKGLMANPVKLKNTPYPVTEEMLYRICRMAGTTHE